MSAPNSRWFVLGVFVLSTAVNYLDRQSLATVAPLIRAEFHLSNADYGLILTAFSLAYALSAPFMGLVIDWLELNRGIALAVAVWSAAGIATGLTRGLGGLVSCRAVLGLAEAGGIPAAGKAIHRYLPAEERALGNAVNQIAVSLGLIAAPPVATWLAIAYGWRMAFVATGVLGLAWIPVWLRVSGPGASRRPGAPLDLGLLRDPRLWAFIAANALSMVLYSLWTNWTTLYLVDRAGSDAGAGRLVRLDSAAVCGFRRPCRRMAVDALDAPRHGGSGRPPPGLRGVRGSLAPDGRDPPVPFPVVGRGGNFA